MRISLENSYKSFVSKVQKNFPKWDKNKDGKIDSIELHTSMGDPSIKGDDAAALAALRAYNRKKKRRDALGHFPNFTQAGLKKLKSAPLSSPDAKRAGSWFRTMKERVDSKKEKLFANALPNPDLSTQGNYPTCGFLASLYSHVRRDPEAIKEMVKELGNGQYAVKFPSDNEPTLIDPPTDTEFALGSRSDDGLWFTAIEKAWSTRLEGLRHPRRRKSRPFENNHALGIESLEGLTGNSVAEKWMPYSDPDFVKGEIPSYFEPIAQALDEKRIVNVGIMKKDKPIKGLRAWHYYSLTGWDQENGTLQIRNPWGRGEPVDENGKARDGVDDGHFEVTFDEFLQSYREVLIEEAPSAKEQTSD